jgi:hypothetical protein
MGCRTVTGMTNTASRTFALIALAAALLAAAIAPAAMASADTPAASPVAGATAEPQLLTVDAEAAPAPLVDALLAAGFRGDPTDKREALYIPVGTAVDVPGGMYLATVDGWMVCAHGVTTAGACGPTTGVVPVSVPA